MNPIQTIDPLAPAGVTNTPAQTPRFTPHAAQRSIPSWREQFQTLMRSCGYCPRTESAYLHWIQEFHHFHTQQPNPPTHSTLDTCHAESFLTHLRENRTLSNSALNQAFNALRIYYERLLQRPFPNRADYPPVRRLSPSPITLSPEDIRRVLAHLNPTYQIHARLIYGSGLRLAELLRIQIHDLQFSNSRLIVRDYKCEPCRATFIPSSLRDDISNQIDGARRLWEADQLSFSAAVRIARVTSTSRPAPPVDWPSSWLFPSTNARLTPTSHNWPRHHQPEDNLQRALRRAATLAGIDQPVSPEILRHSFAAHLLKMGSDLGTVQELIGHNRCFRDSIYRHFVRSVAVAAVSPLDTL